MNDIIMRLRQSLATSNRELGTTPESHSAVLYPELSYSIVGAAIEVHRHIGPGQLESVYQHALARELAFRAIPFEAQVRIEMDYKGGCVGEFVADFVIDGVVIVELKAVERVLAVHHAQVLSYLRAMQLRLGMLINFNVAKLTYGVKRVVL